MQQQRTYSLATVVLRITVTASISQYVSAICTLANLSMLTAAERHRYLSCVYGHDTRGALAVWELKERQPSQGVVWRSFLPIRLQKCRWPQLPSTNAWTVFDTQSAIPLMGDNILGIYGHSGLCYGDAANAGGRRRPPLRLEGHDTWEEVVHQFGVGGITDNPVSRLELQALWMYSAKGSGLWYRTGHTLVMSDTIDLVHALNFTHLSIAHDAPPHFVSKPRLLQLARSVLGADTLIFTHHVDNVAEVRATGVCRGSVYKREVVGLRPLNLTTRASSRVCPPDLGNLAWGWRADNQSCICDTKSMPMLRCSMLSKNLPCN